MTKQPAVRSSAWLRAVAALGAVAIIGATIVLSNSSPASAEGLETFASCDDLRTHVEAFTQRAIELPATGGDGAMESPVASAGEALTADATADSGAGETGGTNIQVEGIDELDLVDVLSDGRILVAREGEVVLIDATGTEILAVLDAPGFTQITFDDERATLWVVADNWPNTTLTRAVLEGDGFTATSNWEVAGRLVALRRAGERVHLVAVDDDYGVMPMVMEDGFTGDEPVIDGGVSLPADADVAVPLDPEVTLPFDGTSPVACDQVLYSPIGGGPATTLVATFGATGDLEPLAATEIVGAGDNVLVTATALYVSTPSYDAPSQVVGIHRFDLDGLVHTGSGSVEGRLLNQFSLDEHAGHLRAAVTIDGGFIGRPMPMPVEGDGGIGGPTEDVVAEPSVDVPEVSPELPDVVEPLNEIVVLDLEGDLDVVGRSPRFGHAGETLHGIRFSGDIAYAVTFLQTDPLYVVDLSQPTSPTVLGEVEVPGFSAYLHPISATQVIGFGPGGENEIVARLFDITDPTTPTLLDTKAIAEDSPIVWDHHALRVDGDRFVVAANRYVTEPLARCGPTAGLEAELNRLYQQQEQLFREMEGQSSPSDAMPPGFDELQDRINRLSECVYPPVFARARIVTLTATGTALAATAIDTDGSDAQRVVPMGSGYLIVGSEITRVDAGGKILAVLS